jgi:hypothetical protein
LPLHRLRCCRHLIISIISIIISVRGASSPGRPDKGGLLRRHALLQQ